MAIATGTAILGAAALGAGASILGSSKASKASSSAANQASATELQMFNQNREDLAPFREAGVTALNKLMGGYSMEKPDRAAIENELLGDQYSESSGTTLNIGAGATLINALLKRAREKRRADAQADISDEVDKIYNEKMKEYEGSYSEGLLMGGPGEFTEDPGYQFRKDEGENAVKNYLSASGRTTTGPGMKSLMQYNQDYASNEYQKFLDRYYRSLNPFMSLAGVGQVATGDTAQLGSQAASGAANSQMLAGQSRASGYINQANSITGGIQSGINNYLTYRGLSSGGSGGVTPGVNMPMYPSTGSSLY